MYVSNFHALYNVGGMSQCLGFFYLCIKTYNYYNKAIKLKRCKPNLDGALINGSLLHLFKRNGSLLHVDYASSYIII